MSFAKVVENFTYKGVIFFLLEKISKTLFGREQKIRGKTVIKSKNDKNISCPKFCKLGDKFFLF